MVKILHNLDDVTREFSRIVTQYADRVGRDIDTEMREQAARLRNEIVRNWPVDTGVSRAAWQGPIKRGHAEYELTNNVVYAPVIEYGGYRGVGPRTARREAEILPGGIQVAGGIFPTQTLHAPVRRGLAKRRAAIRRAIAEVVKG